MHDVQCSGNATLGELVTAALDHEFGLEQSFGRRRVIACARKSASADKQKMTQIVCNVCSSRLFVFRDASTGEQNQTRYIAIPTRACRFAAELSSALSLRVQAKLGITTRVVASEGLIPRKPYAQQARATSSASRTHPSTGTQARAHLLIAQDLWFECGSRALQYLKRQWMCTRQPAMA